MNTIYIYFVLGGMCGWIGGALGMWAYFILFRSQDAAKGRSS